MGTLSISCPNEIEIQLRELQKKTHDKKFGWTAIFLRGYHAIMNENLDELPNLNVKIEKMATRLNFYAQKAVQLEEQLANIKAERGG